MPGAGTIKAQMCHSTVTGQWPLDSDVFFGREVRNTNIRDATEEPRSAIFVGRERELGELLVGLEDAASGRGRLFLLAGEPGIGKSRLADELGHEARRRGSQVLWGRGWEDAGAPPYWPWVQALRSYVRHTAPELIREQMGGAAADIVQMLPEVRAFVPGLPERTATDSPSARFQLFDSTVDFLRRAADATPLVIILDDLQAVDTPSILLLRFIATQLADTRILVVGTYRDVELTPDHPLTQAVAYLAREPMARMLSINGLAEGAVATLIESTAGLAPPARLVTAMWRETGGNPLFLGEAARLLAADGRLDATATAERLRLSVPAGIREVINRRVNLLGERSVGVLTYAAALGPEFSAEALRRVGNYRSDELLELLSNAKSAGLLGAQGGVPGRYHFSHDLIRETLYREMSLAEQTRVHRRIGQALEELYGSSVDSHAAELAHHFFEAAQGDEIDTGLSDAENAANKATTYARRAGEQAATSLAYEEAARLYRMALTLSELEASPDDRVRTELLLALGEAESRAGDLEHARATFLSAVAIARRTGSTDHFARAAVGYGGRFAWARAGNDTQLIPLLQEALVLLGGSDDKLRVRLLVRLACAWRSSPAYREQSDALSREAVELAREQHHPPTLSYALVGRYWAVWWPENPDERLGIAQEMLAVAEASSDAERTIDAHQMLYQTYVDLGSMREARAENGTVVRLVRELRQPPQLWLGWASQVLIALIEGEFRHAQDLMTREIDLDLGRAATPNHDDSSAARMHRFLLARELGRLGEEEGSVRTAVEEFPWYPLHRAALVCLLIDLDRSDEARVAFAELVRDEFRIFYRDSEWLLGISLASEACAALGDAAAAQTLYAQLLPFAGRHAVGHAEGSVGAMDRYLGLLASTMGNLDQAEPHFVAAIQLNEHLGARPWTAHTRHDLATLLRRRGQPGDTERAAMLAAAALATARQLGMLALEARLRDAMSDSAASKPAPNDATEASFKRANIGPSSTRVSLSASVTPRACATSRGCWHAPVWSCTRSIWLARLAAMRSAHIHRWTICVLMAWATPGPCSTTRRKRRTAVA